MVESPGLRGRIERIGKQVLENYCQSRRSVATMIPPIPDSQFIDKCPEGVKLRGQNGYITEVEIFRHLEDVPRNVTVLHQLTYTHQQYSAYVPVHGQCSIKSCDLEPKPHPCHLPKKSDEGETDFLVLGDNFVLVLEVKGAERTDQIQKCYDDSVRQRQRIVELIKSVDSSFPVFDFTFLSNLSGDDVPEEFHSDASLLFREHLKYLEQIFDCATIISELSEIQTTTVKQCLLGLWCSNRENKWNIQDCDLSKCLTDLDDKLERSVVTRRATEEDAQQDSGNQKQRSKRRKYPDNKNMVTAPAVFKDHLKISCVTKEQLDLFECKSRFIWVDGPAGAGKTVVLLGKVIEIALKTPSDERIFIMLPGYWDNPAPKHHIKVLNNIRNRDDISCTEIVYSYRYCEGDISEKLDKAHSLLSQQLSASTDKIVILRLERCLIKRLDRLLTDCFSHIFIDDLQQIYDYAVCDIYEEPNCADKNIISEVLLPVVQNSTTHNTSMWIFSDNAQSWYDKHPVFQELPCVSLLTDALYKLRNHKEVQSKQMAVNLRNTYEISCILDIVRRHCHEFVKNNVYTLPGLWPEQEGGHFLRGSKPMFYTLQTSDTAAWGEILEQEMYTLRGNNSCLLNKKIAVIVSASEKLWSDTVATVYPVVKRWDTTEDKISVLGTANCVSAEFAAVIIIHRYWTDSATVTLPDDRQEEISLSYLIPLLYRTISRARVYCTVVLLDYTPNICKEDDALLAELRKCSDLCRIIER